MRAGEEDDEGGRGEGRTEPCRSSSSRRRPESSRAGSCAQTRGRQHEVKAVARRREGATATHVSIWHSTPDACANLTVSSESAAVPEGQPRTERRFWIIGLRGG